MGLLTDWYNGHWLIFLSLFSLVTFVVLVKKGMIAELVLGWTIVHGIVVGFLGMEAAHPSVSQGIKLAALQGAAQLALVLFFYLAWSGTFEAIMRVIFWVNLALTFACWSFSWGFTGLGLNTSLNGTLLALLLSFELDRHKFGTSFLISIITAIAIMLSGSSMGILALFGGIAIASRAVFKTSLYLLGFILINAVAVVYRFYGEELWSLSSRGPMWDLMLQYISERGDWWWGSGFGTFSYLGPKIQDTVGWTSPGYFVHAHSDVLQMLFECGISGLAIWCLLIGFAFLVMAKRRSLGGAYFFAAFAISCVGNFPLRLPLTAICLAGMLSKALREDRF